MQKHLNINYFGRSLVISGSVILFLSLAADIFGIGGQPNTFGFRQVIGAILGFLLLCIGVVLFWINSDFGLKEFVKTNYRFLTVYLAIGLGLSWSLYIYNCGVRFSPDSVSYQSFALLMHYAGEYDIPAVWPPLYPILLNLAMYMQEFPAEAAAIISCLSMIGSLIVFSLLLCKYSDNLWLIILFILNLFFWNKYLYIFIPAWSEPPFSFLFLVVLYFLILHFEPRNIRYYIYASFVVSLVPLVRYAGLVLVGIFLCYTIYFLVVFRINNFGIIKYILISSISYLPIGLYLYNNYQKTGTLFGDRISPDLTIFENINRVSDVFITDINLYLRILIFISIFFYVVIIINNREGILKAKKFYPLTLILISLFAYTTIIIYTATKARIDPINTRYFAPVYPYILLFSFISLNTLTESEFSKVFRIINPNHIKIVIYGLICLSLFTSIREFNSSINNISNRSNKPTAHPQAGFNISPTLKNINTYINKYLTDHKVMYISVIMDYQPSFRQYFGPDILFREGIISSQNTSAYVFEGIQKYNNYLGIRNYTLSFQKGEELRKINYLRAPGLANENQLLEYLINATDENKINTLILLVYYENLALIEDGNNLSPAIAEYFDLVSLHNIDPYKIYELSRR